MSDYNDNCQNAMGGKEEHCLVCQTKLVDFYHCPQCDKCVYAELLTHNIESCIQLEKRLDEKRKGGRDE